MTPKLHGITEPLEAALIYAELGLAVVPIRKGTKRPPMKAWQKEATQDPEKIRAVVEPLARLRRGRCHR